MSKRKSQSRARIAENPLSSFLGTIDNRIEVNRAAATGSTQFPGAREEWNRAKEKEQMAIPIETLLSDDYYWGKENIWPAVADEIISIWHARCDFDIRFIKENKVLKQDTLYAISYDHAEQLAKEKWPRQTEDADDIVISRDRDLHTVIIETPKGTGKDYEAALIVALLVREYLIQSRDDILRMWNVDHATTISVNLMNRSEKQAKKVTFTEVLKRVNNDFFMDYFPPHVSADDMEYSGRMPQELRFPKNVVVFPGTGSASTGLGYSLGAEIIDECNFMQLSDVSKKSIMSGENYDAAEEAWKDAIVRHRSRFGTFVNGQPVCAGLIVAISSTRLVTDFTQRMAQRAREDKGIFYSTSAFWHRKPLPLSGKAFQFDLVNMRIIDPDRALQDYTDIHYIPQESFVAKC